MPLNAGEPAGYGSVAAAAAVSPGNMGSGSESVPLLIPDPEPDPEPWHPMSKEELEIAAGGPGWRKIRSRLVWLFWLAWLAMLATAVAIVVQSPRPVPTPLRWWQRSLFYQLRPGALFTEAAADADQRPQGISAVRDHLPYLKSLGVGALLLEGLFKKGAPLPDLTVIDESVGTAPQLQQLLVEGNKAGLKVLLDFCDVDLFGPHEAAGNHTDIPSELTTTVQYAVRYWLEQGVAGFALCDTDAAYSQQILLEWRDAIEQFGAEEERIVVVKQTGDSLLHSGSVNATLVQVVVRAILPAADHLLSAQEVAIAVETHLKSVSQEIWPSWTVGGAPTMDLRKLLLVLMMTLPGSPVVQYGEEISHIQNVSVIMDPLQGPSVSSADQAKAKRASLALFSSLSRSRAKEEALLYGSFTFLPFNTTSSSSFSNSSFSNSTLAPPPSSSSAPLLAFLRSWGCVHFLVLLNTGSELHTLDPAWAPELPVAGVFVTSSGMDRLGSTNLQDLTLQPHEALVIKLFVAGSYSP